MRYDQLFREAAAHGEPPLPLGVVEQVSRARGRRTRRQLLVAAPLAVAAVVAAVALSPLGDGQTAPDPRTFASAAPGEPASFFALLDGRAVQEPTGDGNLIQDLGPAEAVAPATGGAWISRSTGTCRSRVELRGSDRATGFDPHGAVPELALSPDGRQLAYARTVADPIITEDGDGCGSSDLIVRDIARGTERIWSHSTGSGAISSLSWAADSTRVAFQTVVCCDRSTTLYVLDTTTNPVVISRLPERKIAPNRAALHDAFFHDPAFAGNELLVLGDFSGDVSAAGVPTGYAVVTSAGEVVAALQEEGVSLDADASGQHLLVALYGGQSPGNLLRFTRGAKDPTQQGRGYAGARW